MNRKLLVIGLDGYESTIGDRMMREGRLPALAELTKRSAQFHLDHGAARRTGLAWEHFSTGLSPEAAQRWSAVDFDPVNYRCVQVGTSLSPFPGALGVDTVVFDPPYFDLSWAPEVQGIVSWGAHDPGTHLRANPSRLVGEIRNRFGDYPAAQWIYGFPWPSAVQTREMGSALVDAVHLRAQIARWLLTERLPAWSLGVVVVSELHSATEALWYGLDERHPLHRLPSAPHARVGLEETYRAVDDLIAALVSGCPTAAVLAVSMHGMGANESDVASMALLPELMYRRQFNRPLMCKPDSGDDPSSGAPELNEHESWSNQLRRYFPNHLNESNASSGRTTDRIRRWIPEPAKRWVKQAMGYRLRMSSLPSWMPADWYSQYWRDMDAFALPSFYDGRIRINLDGREAKGRVRLSEYEAVCTRIENDLRACVDPGTGNSVVRDVIRSHRLVPLQIGPTEADLAVVWEGAQLAFDHPRYGTIGPCPYRRPGGHTGDHGIAHLSAPDIKPGFCGRRSAFDVVPTISDYLIGSIDPKFSGQSFLPMICRREG